MGQFFTLAGLIWMLQNALTLLTTNAVTGNTASGSANVTNLSNTSGLAAGQFVVGAGIPAGTTIVSVNPGASSMVLSNPATATAAGVSLWSYGTLGQSEPLTVHLLTGGVPSDPLTTWAQLTEATYDGYVPQTCAYPFIQSSPDNRNVVSSCQAMTFQPTDYLVPNTITGMAWTYTPPGASSPILVAVEQFQVATNLSIPGDLIRVIPCLAAPTNRLGIQPSPVLE